MEELRKTLSGIYNTKALARKLEIPYDTVISWKTGRRHPSINSLLMLYEQNVIDKILTIRVLDEMKETRVASGLINIINTIRDLEELP